jgi:hypothetical protein
MRAARAPNICTSYNIDIADLAQRGRFLKFCTIEELKPGYSLLHLLLLVPLLAK